MATKQKLVENAAGLFEYVREMLQQGQTRYTNVQRDAREGLVLDFADLIKAFDVNATSGPRLRVHLATDPPDAWALDKPVLTIPRVRITDPPLPPPLVGRFIEGALDVPSAPPNLDQRLLEASEGSLDLQVYEDLDGVPPAVALAAFDEFIQQWEEWSYEEMAAREYRDLYLRVFQASETAKLDSQAWEFVLGLGRLRVPGQGQGDSNVDRPLLTVSVRASVDGRTGNLRVEVPPGATLRLETDMLEPSEIVSIEAVGQLQEAVCAVPAHRLDQVTVVDALIDFTNRALPDARFVEDAVWHSEAGSVVGLRPLLILRRRGAAATIRALDAVITDLRQATDLPEGLAAVVDPDFNPVYEPDHVVSDGGVLLRGDEYVTPLPLNSRQWEVLRRSDSRPLALVQGPPGTGKTHTTAALISHLLAQGKRILVTSAKEQALVEVRDKLPAEVRELAVSSSGGEQRDVEELRAAIQTLSRRTTEFDSVENERDISTALGDLEALLEHRDELVAQLVESRRAETASIDSPFGQATVTELTSRWVAGRSRFDWSHGVLPTPDPLEGDPPLTQVRELAHEFLALATTQGAADARAMAASPAMLSSASTVHLACEALSRCEPVIQALDGTTDPRIQIALKNLPEQALSEVEAAVRAAEDSHRALSRRPEAWVSSALRDIDLGKTAAWNQRRLDIAKRLGEARRHASTVQEAEPIRLPEPPARLAAALEGVLAFADSGGELKKDGAGRLRVGVFAPKAVKTALARLDGATLRGRGPQSVEDLRLLQLWVMLHQCLDDLDAAWPQGTEVSDEESPSERLAWHEDELVVLGSVLDLPRLLQSANQAIARVPGSRAVEWGDRSTETSFVDAIDLVRSQREAADATAVLVEARAALERVGPLPLVKRCLQSIDGRDSSGYQRDLRELQDAFILRDRLLKADEDLIALRKAVPSLAALIPLDPESPWLPRLDELEAAWEWRRLDAWLGSLGKSDPNLIHAQIHEVEQRARGRVSELAALRAWGKAVERLTPNRRSELVAYVNLVKKLGKGKGKYVTQRLTEIQEVLQRASSSVPVWIMPMQQVVEGLEMAQGLFDVVIVDEASQVGLEALLLAYISPRLVVVGDDKQVSPPSVGKDQSVLVPLSDRYLHWNPLRAVYRRYDRSLFDEALMRFPDLITLVEHRRCVPAIIGFSDEIAYAPVNEGLIPVREPGSNALPPFVTTYVPDGEATQGANRENLREAEVAVQRIGEMLQDRRYRGKSIGVISLQGTAQAKLIHRLISSRLGQDAATAIQCGEPPLFQGAERDVIILSMVAAPNQRLAAAVKEENLQRYNVAVSRAKDQIQLVHSIRIEDGILKPEDYRYRLLEYAHKHEQETLPPQPSKAVEPDVGDRHFSNPLSLQVHNLLAHRNYQVVAEYPALGASIDIVAIGSGGKAGVFCYGADWPGDEAYRTQLAYEAELLRCGWRLHRVRHTQLLVDPAGAERDLERFLESAGVLPITPTAVESVAGTPSETTLAPKLPAPTPERFLELVESSNGILPALTPGCLDSLEPVAGEQDTWTTHDGVLPWWNTDQPPSATRGSTGAAIAWRDGRLATRCWVGSIDLTVVAAMGDPRHVDITHPLHRWAERLASGVSVEERAPDDAQIHISVEDDNVTIVRSTSEGTAAMTDADPVALLRSLTMEGS